MHLRITAICHKSWGPGLRPPLSLRQSSFFPSILWTLQGVWAEPAHPLPNILMQFLQSNSFIKSTFMFNVQPGTEISVHAEFSHCRQHWYYGLQQHHTKKWGPVHIWTCTARKWGSGPPQDRRHCNYHKHHHHYFWNFRFLFNWPALLYLLKNDSYCVVFVKC